MPEPTRPLRNIALADGLLDRDALSRSTPGLVPSLLAATVTRVLDVHGDRVPVEGDALAWRAPRPEDLAWYEDGGICLYLGQVEGVAAVAMLRDPMPDEDVAPEKVAPSDATSDVTAPTLVTLRQCALTLPAADAAAATGAVALAHWHATHRRCPRCGGETVPREAGWVRQCPADGSQHFPRTDPAVIMAVVDRGEAGSADRRGPRSADADSDQESDDSRILLARGARWAGPHRSVLAGFVEPGESFEQAVARETFEESGVEVTDVRYLGSQPWPFPASLMVGFIASAATTQLRPQEGEIEEIAWYSRDDVRRGVADGSLRLPGRLSIARALIEHWYGGPLPEAPQTA